MTQEASSDAMIRRVCRAFSGSFAKDEATAKELGSPYWISRVLGSGATGTVLYAKRASDGEPFAVKFVDMEGMPEADRNRAQAEVHCLLNCDYFSILKCHEDLAKRDPQNPENVQMIALVLDYANAGDLRQEIRSRAKTGHYFEEHEAGMLFLQVLLAVHHVHSRHMIHRDIKSANILLCSNGLVKLGDFGFSKTYTVTVSEDVGRTFCGTPYYVAPEIWRRKPYSKKADMFSLGVLLYELLTLKRPFDGANMNEVMQKTLAGQYEPLPSKVSPEMCEVVASLLNGDPMLRPSSSKLLDTPIWKLFMSGLLEIVQSQPIFQGHLRETIAMQIQQTKLSLKPERRRMRSLMDKSSSVATTHSVVLEGGQAVSNTGEVTVFEGFIKKQSQCVNWKRRYLCIRAELYHNEDGDNTTPRLRNATLFLTISKETLSQQCIPTPFSDIEDAFPVPPKYTGTNTPHVFAVACTTGKRMLFQAKSDEERDIWMANIQDMLGIGDNYPCEQANCI